MRLTAVTLTLLFLLSAGPVFGQVGGRTHVRGAPDESQTSDPGVEQVIARAEGHFGRGKRLLEEGETRAATQEFDMAVNAVLESGMDVRATPKLQSYYLQLVDKIYRLEVTRPGAPPAGPKPPDPPAGLVEQKFEPSPLDEPAHIALRPSDVAEYRGKPCPEDLSGKIELRGFKLGMSVPEVRARVPNLRLKPLDKHNHAGFSASVRSDRFLSQAASLKGVEVIDFEFIDDKLSDISFLYDDSVKWQSGAAFAEQVSSAMGIKSRWARYESAATADDDLHILVCRDVMLYGGIVRVGGEGRPMLSARDLAAHDLIRQRIKAAIEQQKADEERRRRTFKP